MPTSKADMINATRLAYEAALALPDETTPPPPPPDLPTYTWEELPTAVALHQRFAIMPGECIQGFDVPPHVTHITLLDGEHIWTGPGHADPDQQEAEAMLSIDRPADLPPLEIFGEEDGDDAIMMPANESQRCTAIRVKHGAVHVQDVRMRKMLSGILCESGSDGDLIVQRCDIRFVLRYAVGYWGRRDVVLQSSLFSGDDGIGENLTRFYCNSLNVLACDFAIPEQEPGGKGITAMWCVDAPGGVSIRDIESHGRLRFGYGVNTETENNGGGSLPVGPITLDIVDVMSWQSAGTPIELGPRVVSAELTNITVTNWRGQGDTDPVGWWLYCQGADEIGVGGVIHPACGPVRWSEIVRNNEAMHGVDGVKTHGPWGDWSEA